MYFYLLSVVCHPQKLSVMLSAAYDVTSMEHLQNAVGESFQVKCEIKSLRSG